METVNSILDFHFSPVLWNKYAVSILSPTIIRLNEEKIGELYSITELIGKASFTFNGTALIPHVFRKFKSIYKNGTSTSLFFERRELRTLTYCLCFSESNSPPIFESEKELSTFFDILDLNWRDSSLMGLVESLLISWSSENTKSKHILSKYINFKLSVYTGSRTALQSFKSNLKFFDLKNGNLVLGNEIAIKKFEIYKAEEYLSLPQNWFQYSYFLDVILAYYEKNRSQIEIVIDDLTAALIRHNNINCSKKLIAKLLLQAATLNDLDFQSKIKNLAFKLIGDPGNMSNWLSNDTFSSTEKIELNDARSILNEWVTRQFINVFFEKCINDPRRKSFWLKYTNQIIRFRVVGSKVIKELLLSDSRIADYVLPRFSKTSSVSDCNAALMFIIKNYLFIEFSDLGAFYAYKLSNPNAPSIDEPNFKATTDLKTPSMVQLIYRTGNSVDEVNDEGRLGHIGRNWENVVAYWIKQKIGC